MKRKYFLYKIFIIFLLTFQFNYLLTDAADEENANDTLYGDEVSIRKAPYLALIKTVTGICTGTIISEDRILTSGSCFQDADAHTKVFVGATTDSDYVQELHITNVWRASQSQDEKFPFRKFENLVVIEVGGINLVTGKVEIMPLESVLSWGNGPKTCTVAAYRETFHVMVEKKPPELDEISTPEKEVMKKQTGETEVENKKVVYTDSEDETKGEISNINEESESIEDESKDTEKEESMEEIAKSRKVGRKISGGKQQRISRDVSKRSQITNYDESYGSLEFENRMIGAQVHLLSVNADYGSDTCDCPEKGVESRRSRSDYGEDENQGFDLLHRGMKVKFDETEGAKTKRKLNEVTERIRTTAKPGRKERKKREYDSSNVVCVNYDGKPTCFANTGGPLICDGILMGIGSSILSCDKPDYSEDEYEDEYSEDEEEEEEDEKKTEKGFASQQLDEEGNIINGENNERPEEIAAEEVEAPSYSEYEGAKNAGNQGTKETKKSRKRRRAYISHVKSPSEQKIKNNYSTGKNQTLAARTLNNENDLKQALRSFITPECHGYVFFDTFTFIGDFKDWLDIEENLPGAESFPGPKKTFKLGDDVNVRGHASIFSPNMMLNLLLTAIILLHKYIF